MQPIAAPDELIRALAGPVLLPRGFVYEHVPDLSTVPDLAYFDVAPEMRSPACDAIPKGAEKRFAHV
jgi:hypothetical protein